MWHWKPNTVVIDKEQVIVRAWSSFAKMDLTFESIMGQKS